MTYDLIIIGAGPAGVAAAVYAARKKMKTLLLAPEWGGQSNVSEGVQNWIGTVSLTGIELAAAFKKHVEAYANGFVEIKSEYVENLEKTENGFSVKTNKGDYDAKTLLVATGSTRRKLDVPGAVEFENKGVVYCASCDGPLFAGQNVVVVGGGNAAFETAAQLLAYCPSVTLIHRSATFKADEVTVEKVLANPNMHAVMNAQIKEVKGDTFVTGVVYIDKDGQEVEIPCSGVFVEIGLIPATDFAAALLDRDEYNRIIIDPWTQMTSVPGIWAAGDATNVKYHQNNIAAGDGVKALEDIYMYLKTRM